MGEACGFWITTSRVVANKLNNLGQIRTETVSHTSTPVCYWGNQLELLWEVFKVRNTLYARSRVLCQFQYFDPRINKEFASGFAWLLERGSRAQWKRQHDGWKHIPDKKGTEKPLSSTIPWRTISSTILVFMWCSALCADLAPFRKVWRIEIWRGKRTLKSFQVQREEYIVTENNLYLLSRR